MKDKLKKQIEEKLRDDCQDVQMGLGEKYFNQMVDFILQQTKKENENTLKNIKEEFEERIREETLRKNERRNSYFLELNINEILNILNKVFEQNI